MGVSRCRDGAWILLTAIEIRNFRKFDRYAVDLGPRNLLVGPNNAGKSTLIEALRLVSIVVNRFGSLNFDGPPDWLDDRHQTRGVAPSLRGLDFDLGKETFHQYADPPAEIKALFDSGNSVTVYVGPDSDVFAVVCDRDGIAIESKREARLFDQPRIGIQPQVGPLARRERPLADRYVRGALDSTLAPTHFRNQLRLLDGYVADFTRSAEATWPGLRIDGIEILGPGEDCHLELFVRDGAFVGEVAAMGHGLQMWLQLMWFLSRSQHDGTVVLDEPDVYMHPDLQRRLIRFLLNRPQQVVIATHSIEMIAEVEPSELVSIDSGRRRSRRAQDVSDVQKIVDQVGGVHNIEFARLAQADRYLAVAQPELRLLKRWHDLVAPEATDALDLMPTFPLDAWDDWPYAVAIKRAIEARREDGVTAVCVLAPGVRSDAEIQARRHEAAAEGMDLHIWTRRSLANFALNPAVIARVLHARASSGAPTPDRVAGRMDAIMDSLCDHVVRDSPATSEGEIRRQWRSLDGRLAMVPAHLVLLRLAAWSRREYGCSAGIADIVGAFHRDDVDAEVVRVVDALCHQRRLGDVRDHAVEMARWPESRETGTDASAGTSTADPANDVLDLLRDAGVVN